MAQETPVAAEQLPFDSAGDGPRLKGNKRAIDWSPILKDHAENPFTPLEIIAARGGVSASGLSRRIKRAAELPPIDRAKIVERLFRLVDLQVQDLQEEMSVMKTENRRSGEKEVVLLGRIAANLEKLAELNGDKPSQGRKDRSRTKSIVDLRSKLVERIEHLKRQ